ncbi:MAG: DDE-type integrase/transposase/recombinase, partial [Candidatus Poseidoniia archaeon]
RYSPTEGEALAVAWGLEHARMFVLGCEKLLVSTDHKPLLGILRDRDLNSIPNPRILGIKERTLPYQFDIQYNPGKWHRGPDGFSRNPVSASPLSAIFSNERNDGDQQQDDPMEVHVHTILQYVGHPSRIASIEESSNLITAVELEHAASTDPEYQRLIQAVKLGFPLVRGGTEQEYRLYWGVRHRLSMFDNIVMMDNRIVVPTAYRARVLKSLHSAHQGVSSMLARARQTVYWPGLDTAVHNVRFSCHQCNERAPAQSKEPLQPSQAPLYPYQQICCDYFELGHNSYLSIADRFSGWISIYHFINSTTSRQLISICRALFTSYGAAEELSSDGGPQFTSHEFQRFMKDWGVEHRISSVAYPQSNGRAEVGVKTAKRIIFDNTSSNGSLDNDKAARAILQYRNTPIAGLGLSPAQLLLHRHLRDHIPAHPRNYRLHKEWVVSASEREKSLARRNEAAEASYNRGSHELRPLEARSPVHIQSHKRWDRTGRVVEVLPNRQYRIRVDGSGRITLRNRRFLRLKDAQAPTELTPSAAEPMPAAPSPTLIALPEPTQSEAAEPVVPHEHVEAPTPMSPTPVATHRRPPKILRDISDHNRPGLTEVPCERPSRLRSGR